MKHPLSTRLMMTVGIVLTATTPAYAQINFFGQNKIQYRNFEWRVLSGEHVDLYFYPEEDELARLSLAYAEESYRFLEVKFGHSPSRRIPLIVYASHTDFEQTNILPFVPPEGMLGVTEFLKRRVTLPFNGSYAEFRHTLRHELVHAFQLSVLSETYGRFPRANKPGLPLWWSEGLAEFWSAGEDSRDEMILRALTVSGPMPSLQQLTFVRGTVVYPLGGAIHRWLAEQFGDWRVQVFYRNLWKYRSFAEAIHGVYGVSLADLNNQLQHHFRQRYFPAVTTREPLNLSSRQIATLAIAPVAYRLPGDTATRLLYLSPSTGYMNIYSTSLSGPGRKEVVVKGERSAEFESFHPFASRIDVREGFAVFSSKYLERDALFFWNLTKSKVAGRYQFPQLVSILSPTWAPDGQSVVFSGLSVAGYSDLYRLWLADGRLEQLTTDRYQDIDPSFSPDGRSIVFASDRTPYGPDGSYNLFVLDIDAKEIRYLTFGQWRDQAPRWASNGRVYFSSDREGFFDIYSVDSLGRGRRITNTLTGAFDPQWVESERTLLYGGFSGLTLGVFRSKSSVDTSDVIEFELPRDLPERGWSWSELVNSPYTRTDPTPYERRFSLDFAAGDALVVPGLGAAQGATFLFSDLLSDHLVFLNLTSFQGNGVGGLIDNINGSAFYVNQKQRLNWGVGIFRLRGLFFEGDFENLFDETSFGTFTEFRWPFSRFSRVESQLRIERSDRFDLVGGDSTEPRRVGWLVSNFVSLVRDNSLWLPAGPIDGKRTRYTAGISNDLSNGRFDSWTLAVDHRRYMRVALRSAYAIRVLGYYAAGNKPPKLSIGGSLGLRGYPRIGRVSGTRAFLLSQELRFPLTNFVSLGFPFGELRLPGIQGALFADIGGAWLRDYGQRGLLGSGGIGFRMPIVFPIVLRLDLGLRFSIGETAGYAITPPSQRRRFLDLFFGFNY